MIADTTAVDLIDAVRDLVRRLKVDPSVVSRQVALLARAGLVTRRPDPEDGRASLLALSPAGDECLRRHREQWAAWFRRAMAGWPEQEAATLTHLLRRLSADVLAALPSGTPGLGSPEHPEHPAAPANPIDRGELL